MVMLKEVPDPERFGVPVIEKGRIVRIEEKPKKPLSSYAVIGIYFYDGTVFDRIRRLKPSGRGEYEITDINNSYIDEGTLRHTCWKAGGPTPAPSSPCGTPATWSAKRSCAARKKPLDGAQRMKLLVTGGAGFIGSNFVHQTLARHPEWKLMVLDKLTYAGNLQNLEPALQQGRCEFVQMDICDRGVLEQVRGCDAVIHFAAESHVDRSIEDAAAFVRTNVDGTHNLMQACREAACRASCTSAPTKFTAAWATKGCSPKNRRCSPTVLMPRPRRLPTCWCWPTFTPTSFPALVTRCSNNYGPISFPRIYSADDCAGDGGRAASGVWHGQQRPRLDPRQRSLQCARRRVAAWPRRRGVQHRRRLRDAQHRSGQADLARRWADAEDLIQFVTDRPGHDLRYAINCEKISHELGWQPQVRFDEGLARTIAWYRENQPWLDEVRSGNIATTSRSTTCSAPRPSHSKAASTRNAKHGLPAFELRGHWFNSSG